MVKKTLDDSMATFYVYVDDAKEIATSVMNLPYTETAAYFNTVSCHLKNVKTCLKCAKDVIEAAEAWANYGLERVTREPYTYIDGLKIRNMTYLELYGKFCKLYPDRDVYDFRPATGYNSITIWLREDGRLSEWKFRFYDDDDYGFERTDGHEYDRVFGEL